MLDVHTHIEGCDSRNWAIVLNRIMILLRGAIVYTYKLVMRAIASLWFPEM